MQNNISLLTIFKKKQPISIYIGSDMKHIEVPFTKIFFHDKSTPRLKINMRYKSKI